MRELSSNSRSGVSSAPAGALKILSRITAPGPADEAVAERLVRPVDSGAVGPATATAQRMDDPARHRTIINVLLAAHIGRQKRRDPSLLRIGKPEEIIHLVTSSSEAMNHPRIKSGRRLSGPDPSKQALKSRATTKLGAVADRCSVNRNTYFDRKSISPTAPVDTWFYPCETAFFRREPIRADQTDMPATNRRVWAGNGASPNPGNNVCLAASILFRQTDIGIKVPDLLDGAFP